MKIFAQYLDTKFINSLSYCTSANITTNEIKDNLYQIHYRYNFDTYIFCANLITQEIFQFISEFAGQKIQCILYHPENINPEVIKAFDNINCRHLGHEQHHNIIDIIPPLVHKHIFLSNPIAARTRDMVSFLDYKQQELPQEFIAIVYPQSKQKFQFFTKHFLHNQNLGDLNEMEKATILNSSKTYLSIDHHTCDYSYEAIMCGNRVLVKDKDEYVDKHLDMTDKIKTYDQFIGEYL